MNKKTNKQRKEQNSFPPVNLVFPDNMSNKEMQELLVNSLLDYDKAKKDLEIKAEEEALLERQKLLGYKDYSDRKLIPRLFLQFFNRIAVIFRILFMSRERIKGDYATTVLMKIGVSLLFGLAKWLLWIVSICCFLSYPLSQMLPNNPKIELSMYPAYIGFGVLAFIFAQLFRIASIEIEKMKDHNYIVDIFAAVAAIVAIIVSLAIR